MTGIDPFSEEISLGSLLEMKRRWTGSDLRRALPNAPTRLIDVISKCLQGDASKRYSSAAALARDLDAILPKITFHALHDGITSKALDVDS